MAVKKKPLNKAGDAVAQPAKRKGVRKPGTNKVSTPAKKVAKKTSRASASTAKAPVKKMGAKKVSAKAEPRTKETADAIGTDKLGLRIGSDVSIAAAEMLKGGTSKHEVSMRILELLPDKETRHGRPKAPASVMGQAMKKLTELGYAEAGTWKMVRRKASN